MAFDFPNTPVEGDTYTAPNGSLYTYSGACWRRGSASTTGGYVLKSGDTMTGALVLPGPDPVGTLHATHKQYVDKTIATMSLYQGTWAVATNVPDLNVPPNSPLNGYSWTAQTVDPSIPETAPAGIPGIGGMIVQALDTIKWVDALQAYELVRGAIGISQMTIADAPPAGAFHGQQWFDSDAGKNYVYYDDGTSQQWVQTSGGGGGSAIGIPDDAPADGLIYGRQNLAWVEVSAAALPIIEVDGVLFADMREHARYVPSTNYVPADAPPEINSGGWILDSYSTSQHTAMWRQELYSYATALWRSTGNATTWNPWQPIAGTGGGIADAPSDGTTYGRNNAAWTAVLKASDPIPYRVPVGDAFPGAPVEGTLHFLGTDASLYIYALGAWVEVSAP